MTKMLVTGGSGFIGSNFIRYTIKEKPDVSIWNLDGLTYAGNPENLSDLESSSNYTFVHGDITDEGLVSSLFETHSFDKVVNFAAESHVDRSIKGPRVFSVTNILGTQVLLDVAKASWGDDQDNLFLQVSTDEVYGSLGAEGLFREDSPLKPNSPYSASKTSADLLCRSYFKTFGFPVLVTRCSNNYGPYQFPEKLIPLMILNAVSDKPLPVYGDGKNVRDWIHVTDHVKALWAVLEKGVAGEIYNIGGGNERENIWIVKTLLSILDKPSSLIQYVTDRPAHDRRYAIDSSKIESELGWSPDVSFEEGLRQTVSWYLENPKWCQNVKSGAYLKYYEEMYGNRS